MKTRIAVASTDGKVVNQHFGRADTFYIVEADEDTMEYWFVEKRNAEPVCHGGDHEADSMKQAVRNLSDCNYVLVSRAGMRARCELEQAGTGVYEIPDSIDNAVDKLLRYIKVQRLLTF